MKQVIAYEWAKFLCENAHMQGFHYLMQYNSRGERVACVMGMLGLLAVKHGVITQPELHPDSYFADRFKFGDRALGLSGTASLPDSVVEWAGLKRRDGQYSEHFTDTLTMANDAKQVSFEKLADIIGKNWERL